MQPAGDQLAGQFHFCAHSQEQLPVATAQSVVAASIMQTDRRPQRTQSLPTGLAPCRPIPSQPQLRPILPAPTPGCLPPIIFGTHPLYPPNSALALYTQSALSLLAAPEESKLRASQRFSTPSIFQGQKQRSGKWILEEEQYASALIKLFEKGFLTDCENGSTLRSYLSRKLHCPPMRISKKYAGKGIGKMLFICRVRLNLGGVRPCLEELKVLEKQAGDKEQLFYKALFPESIVKQHTQNGTFSGGSSIPSNLPVTNSFVPIVSNHLQVVAGYPMASAYPAQVLPSSNALGLMPALTARTTSNVLSTGPVNALEAALKESFVRALQQAAPNQPGTLHSSNIGNVVVDTSVQVNNPVTNIASKIISHSSNRETVAHMPGNVQAASTTEQTSYSTGWTSSLELQGDSDIMPVDLSNTNFSLPDFLSGFDKATFPATGRSISKQSDEAHLPSSPAFTSRSFDDFHRFLGEDLSRLDTLVTGSSTTGQAFPNGDGAFSISHDDKSGMFSIDMANHQNHSTTTASTDYQNDHQQQQHGHLLPSVYQHDPPSIMTSASTSYYDQVRNSESLVSSTTQHTHHSGVDLFPVERLFDAYHNAVTVSETNGSSGRSSRNRSCATSSDEGEWDHHRNAKRLRLEDGL